MAANPPGEIKKGFLARFKEIGGTPDDHPPWRLVYNFQFFLRCNKEPCLEPICKEVNELINHRRECVRGRSCDFPNCWMYMPVCSHYSSCKSSQCAECLEIIIKVDQFEAEVSAANANLSTD